MVGAGRNQAVWLKRTEHNSLAVLCACETHTRPHARTPAPAERLNGLTRGDDVGAFTHQPRCCTTSSVNPSELRPNREGSVGRPTVCTKSSKVLNFMFIPSSQNSPCCSASYTTVDHREKVSIPRMAFLHVHQFKSCCKTESLGGTGSRMLLSRRITFGITDRIARPNIVV